MDFISEEFLAARTGEALEERLRDSDTFWQQMKSLHEASKAFSKDSGMSKKCWKLYDRLEDEWTKYNIRYGEDRVLKKEDMALLIEVEDELHNMDQVLEQLAGHGHASGEFIKLDNVFDVIYRNSHAVYSENPEEGQALFFQILMSRDLTPEQRADILMNGTVQM